MAGCKEDDGSLTAPVDDEFDPATATLLKTGELMGVGHSVSGTASLYDKQGKKVVVLDPYMSQNGPDLKVYLSKDQEASQYINLGALKSITGKQSYEVPANTDIAGHDFVLVWCERFTVIFGKAELK